jgi:organic hydroperoxide reductase OsmC/OhrA
MPDGNVLSGLCEQRTPTMAGRQHVYQVIVTWIGNRGAGTPDRTGYGREHSIEAAGKPPIAGSSDPAFRGDPARWNPEELLLASLSACHKLWYLDLCARSGVSVVSYRDEARAAMAEEPDGAGRFVGATLYPVVSIRTGGDIVTATRLHHDAHRHCFIANSVNFPVTCEPVITYALP